MVGYWAEAVHIYRNDENCATYSDIKRKFGYANNKQRRKLVFTQTEITNIQEKHGFTNNPFENMCPDTTLKYYIS